MGGPGNLACALRDHDPDPDLSVGLHRALRQHDRVVAFSCRPPRRARGAIARPLRSRTLSASLAYRVEFDPAAPKDLEKLDRAVQRRLVGFLRTRVTALDDPRSIGELLAGVRPWGAQ
jgi:hypothetical protein